MSRRRIAALLVAALLAGTTPALAQTVAQVTPAPPIVPTQETFEIGLSTDTISVGTNFGGAQFVVFGALDNADARIQRQGRYDIVVVLEGPRRNLVVREKQRTFGLWINRGSEQFAEVPISYSLAATRPLRDIAPAETLRQFGLGLANMPARQSAAPAWRLAEREEYAAALRRLKANAGLFQEVSGAIEFVSPTLFRASLRLPADLPVGRHVAKAYLFREGVFLRERQEDLWVVKTGFENRISAFAANNGTLYGLFAVALAVLTGWFGRVLFKRD